MNNKGFTLTELLAVIVILAIIAGISFSLLSGSFKNAKDKTEDLFIDTIRDAMEMYLSSDATSLSFSPVVIEEKQCYIQKRNGYDHNNNLKYKNVVVYGTVVTMEDVINSNLNPLSQDDLVNPAKEEIRCANAADININIYKDEDYVYYYSIDKSDFVCLNNGTISSLPGEFICE